MKDRLGGARGREGSSQQRGSSAKETAEYFIAEDDSDKQRAGRQCDQRQGHDRRRLVRVMGGLSGNSQGTVEGEGERAERVKGGQEGSENAAPIQPLIGGPAHVELMIGPRFEEVGRVRLVAFSQLSAAALQ